jgi:hypothetical protein
MARQFREQLEEEAHNLEKQMEVDPDIDTSLDPKPKPQAEAAPQPAPPPAEAAAPAPPAPPSPPVTPVETEEDFYPPDHHMHPSNRAPEPDPRAGAQAEFDLTSPPVDGPKP